MADSAQQFRDHVSRYVSDVFRESALSSRDQARQAIVTEVVIPGLTDENSVPVPRLGPVICCPPDGVLQSLTGFETTVERLRRLAAAPAVARLAYVRQLSTASIAVAISASHTRLEHLLGAFDVAIRMLQPAARYTASGLPPYDIQRDVVVKAVLVLAFFHDVFHPPFGHVLDPLSPVLFRRRDTPRLDDAARDAEFERTAAYFRPRWKGAPPDLVPLLRDVFDTDAEIENVVNTCVSIIHLGRRGELPDAWKPFAFIFDILWSALDHDRIDYIARDFVHSLVYLSPPYHVADIVNGLDCHEVNREVRLVFGANTSTTIQELINRRTQLYAFVYEAKEKARYDAMLQHAAGLLLDEAGVFYSVSPAGFTRDFLRLSDFDFVRIATTPSRSPRRLFAAALARDVMSNRPFVLCHYNDVSNAELGILSERWSRMGKQLEQRIVEKAIDNRDAFGFDYDPGLIAAALSDVIATVDDSLWVDQHELDVSTGTEVRYDNHGRAQIELPKQDSEHVFWCLAHGSSDFRVIVELERLLWERLVAKYPAAAEARDKLARAIVDQAYADVPPGDRGDASAAMIETMSEWPPIFIYMALTGRGARLIHNDKVAQRATLALDSEKKPVPLRLPDRESANHCWLAVYRPAAFGPVGCKFDQVVDQVARELVESGDWATAFAIAQLRADSLPS